MIATTAFAWKKLGLIFRPDPSKAWMRSHAAVPTPFHLDGSRYRVFFSSRDEANRSHVGFFDVDLEAPDRILRVSEAPVLAPGPLGTYDGDGIYVESAVRAGDTVRLYTIGVVTGHTPPLFYAAIGLATGADGEHFAKHGRAPIMTVSEHDPCLVTAPFVLFDRGRWRMWYVSGEAWTREPHGLQSHYHVKYAESDDGLAWRRDGRVCVTVAGPHETNVARLWVVPDGDAYRGWFSASGPGGYRIGYAESPDGLAWTRRDHLAGIEPSASGWDASAQAYPAVVRHGGQWFMFYNGNGFGREGVGLAVAPA